MAKAIKKQAQEVFRCSVCDGNEYDVIRELPNQDYCGTRQTGERFQRALGASAEALRGRGRRARPLSSV